MYTLPAITVEGQKTSVGVVIDDVKFRKWLSRVRKCQTRGYFGFRWFEHPHIIAIPLSGEFFVVYRPEGIYLKFELCFPRRYQDVEYPLDEFCRMLFEGRRPSFGLRVTVKV